MFLLATGEAQRATDNDGMTAGEALGAPDNNLHTAGEGLGASDKHTMHKVLQAEQPPRSQFFWDQVAAASDPKA